MTLFNKRYRIESARKAGWNYAAGVKYFVTLCTANRRCCLGEVSGIEMQLSIAGQIVAEEWQATPRVRPHVILDAWQVMPNHLHGILIISHPPLPDEPSRPAGSTLAPDSLSSIIGQFKGACTRRIRQAGIGDFGWQERFYDKIIRSEKSLVAIRQYIHDNPRKWAEDSDNPVNWQTLYRNERLKHVKTSHIER